MKSQSVWRPRHLLPVAPETLRPSVPEESDAESYRPFGLQYLVDPPLDAASDIEMSAMRFDEASQMAVLIGESGSVPACKHTSGKTKTTTNVNDRQSSDDDEDYEQD